MAFVAWVLAKFTGEAIKGGTEIAKTVSEIPKIVIETEKARLEVIALKREKRERDNFILPATFQDVRDFDPKFGLLQARIEADRVGLDRPDTGRRTQLHLPIAYTSRSTQMSKLRRLLVWTCAEKAWQGRRALWSFRSERLDWGFCFPPGVAFAL